MRPGDYTVHIYVERAKNILMDEGHTSDPLVELSLMGEKKYTKSLAKIGPMDQAVWNEHIFFELKNQTEEELAHGLIEVKLQDKGFFKQAMIGYY